YERFEKEIVQTVSDGTPESDGNPKVDREAFNAAIWQRVKREDSAIDGRAIGQQPGFRQGQGSRTELIDDRWASDAVDEARWQPIRIERSGHIGHRGGTIEIVAYILRAAPDRLDRRSLELPRDLDCLYNIVEIGPPAEATAEVGRHDLDCVRRNAGGLRGEKSRQISGLMPSPHLDAGLGDQRCCIQRLHGGVCQEGGCVRCGYVPPIRGRGTARLIKHPTRSIAFSLVERGPVGREYVVRGNRQGLTVIPRGVQTL